MKNILFNTIYIKNMVCNRCIEAVRQIADRLSLEVIDIQLGELKLAPDYNSLDFKVLDEQLEAQGFQRLDDKKSQLVEKIKAFVIHSLYTDDNRAHYITFSQRLQSKLGVDYGYLSSLFSQIEGITLEKYLILQRIERAKELLAYEEMSLTQIADALDYSSVAHLSGQFKKVTGLSPSHFKKMKHIKRQPIDKL